jgi:hypothetical protein
MDEWMAYELFIQSHLRRLVLHTAGATPGVVAAVEGEGTAERERERERERVGAGARARWQLGKLWLFFPPGLSSLLVMLVAKEANQA